MQHSALWETIRQRTPAADAFVHWNHASTSLPDDRVLRAQQACIELERKLGAHRALEALAPELARLAPALATLLHAKPHQVALQASASRAFAMALSAVAPGKRVQVFVTPYEWVANLMAIEAAHRCELRPLKGNGGTWAQSVERALAQRAPDAVPVVSLPLTSASGSCVSDAPQVAQLVHAAGGWLFVDASQTVGRQPVDFEALGADVLYFPARKWLRGPRGIAVAAFSERAISGLGAPAAPDIYGSRWSASAVSAHLSHAEGARRFQSYDRNAFLCLALLTAVEVLQETGVEVIHARVAERAATLTARLEQWSVYLKPHLAEGFVGLQRPGLGAAGVKAVADSLWKRGINVGHVGPAYAPLELDDDAAFLRFTPHGFTSDAELDALDLALREHCSSAACAR